MGEDKNFITTAQETQHALGNKWQTRKFLAFQAKACNTQRAIEPLDPKKEDTTSTVRISELET